MVIIHVCVIVVHCTSYHNMGINCKIYGVIHITY